MTSASGNPAVTTLAPLEPARSLAGEVPVFWAECNLPFLVGLLFRVGQADETLPTLGVSHLVEHLAIAADAERGLIELNGRVDGTTTLFWAVGDQERALEAIQRIARSLAPDVLAALPHERVHREVSILQTEASQRGTHPATHAALLRFGAVGHGLLGTTSSGSTGCAGTTPRSGRAGASRRGRRRCT